MLTLTVRRHVISGGVCGPLLLVSSQTRNFKSMQLLTVARRRCTNEGQPSGQTRGRMIRESIARSCQPSSTGLRSQRSSDVIVATMNSSLAGILFTQGHPELLCLCQARATFRAKVNPPVPEPFSSQSTVPTRSATMSYLLITVCTTADGRYVPHVVAATYVGIESLNGDAPFASLRSESGSKR